MKTTKETEQTRETLLKVLQTYKTLIDNTEKGLEKPTLDDLSKSINYVLKRNGIQ